MGKMSRKCIEQFGEHVYSKLWEVAEQHGFPRNADTVRKLELFHRIAHDLVNEDNGLAPEFDLTDAQKAEIESLGWEFNAVAMSFVMLRGGLGFLSDGDIEAALDGVTSALMVAGWIGGAKGAPPSIEITRRAKISAAARHAQTYAKREEVRQYWLDHIDRRLSNAKAAEILFKKFDLEHRTLAGYVASFKRELLAKN